MLAKRELEEKQAEIQENERKRYETKLRQLEETFKQDITKLESNETLYQKRIAELETKTNYHEKKNESIGNMVTELKHEKDEYETTFTQRLSTMETQLRERQRKEEEKGLLKLRNFFKDKFSKNFRPENKKFTTFSGLPIIFNNFTCSRIHKWLKKFQGEKIDIQWRPL